MDTFREYERSQQLVEVTWAKDAEKVAKLVEAAHDQAGNKTYHTEAALSYAIQLAYYAAKKYYTTILELDSGKGYVDLLYLPAPRYADKPLLLIELKNDKSANTAMDQIKQRNYPAQLEYYKGNILLIGINYDKKIRSNHKGYKHHTCVIEEA